MRTHGRTRKDQHYKKSETVTKLVNRYDLEKKTDKHPAQLRDCRQLRYRRKHPLRG